MQHQQHQLELFLQPDEKEKHLIIDTKDIKGKFSILNTNTFI